MKKEESDIWSNWLLHRRHGNNQNQAQNLKPTIEKYASKIIDGARLSDGMTLVDIGSGEGLIAFGAVARVGDSLRVILTDISKPMLSHAEHIAEQLNIKDQCTFINCSADNLQSIPSASVDVVTTRSVLAYVDNKPAALQEFYRILKPGGRISIAEPIFRDESINLLAMKNWIMNNVDNEDIERMRLLHQWKSAQYPDSPDEIMTNSLTNYSERDLFFMAKECQFTDIHLELHIDAVNESSIPWEVFLDQSPHPLAPTLREILKTKFSLEDQIVFEQMMRYSLEKDSRDGIDRMAYLTATKSTGHHI